MRIPELWLGSEESFMREAFQRLLFIENLHQYDPKMYYEEAEDYSLSDHLADSLVSKSGNVGILSIEGALTSDESIFNLFFGGVAYPTIANAINRLLSDDEVKSIVMAIDSPGGDASGIHDLGTFVKDASKIKPIHSWTGKNMFSAAYWAGACCDSVRASTLGETGSVGAIMTFKSIARALKEDGIDVHIERAGKYKALLNPAEEITEQGKMMMREKVEKLHSFFIENIESARPKLRSVPRAEWAEGKTYFAEDAIGLGLVDGPIISLSALVSELQKKADKDIAKSSRISQGNNHPGGINMGKQVLLDQQNAARLASGVPLEDVEVLDPEKATEVSAEASDSGSIEAPKKDSESTNDVNVNDGNVNDGNTDATQGSVKATDGLSAYLQDRVMTLEAKLSELSVDKTRIEDQLTTLKGVEEVLSPIVVEATQRLQVALGQAPSSLNGFPARTLAETYAATKREFESRFKIGRSSVEASDESKQGRSLAELRLISKVGSDKQ